MTKNTLSVLLTVGVLLSAAFFAALSVAESAEALKAQGTTSKLFGAKTSAKVCGDQLCSASRTQPVTKPQTSDSEKDGRPMACTKEYMPVCGVDGKTYGNACTAKAASTEIAYKGECKSSGKDLSGTSAHKSNMVTNTITSIQDPAIGHESHQLAVILPPSDKIYKGTVTYSASEPVQLVALTGPLAEGEDKGQPIWTPDGKTKFALTLVDANAAGTWNFAGNALALHTKKTEPFTASYAVSYAEKQISETVKTGTVTSIQDPAIGHESHQLAVILPLSDKPYSGIVTYSASEPVQLVALTGPLAEGEDKGQPIWTPDGKTKFALTLVDANAAGTWNFAGNALALHTKKTEPFTASYTVVASQ